MMESRCGLSFAVMDRQSFTEMRRQRGWGSNPWATHARFILSQALVRDEAYAGPLRDWLGEEGKQALLLLDQLGVDPEAVQAAWRGEDGGGG